MLDLTTAFGELYQVKLLDGTVLELRRPTQALQNSILQLQKLGESEKNSELVMKETMGVFCRILNRNAEGIEFTVEGLGDEYDYSIALVVMGDYFRYYNQEVSKVVNFRKAQ